MIPATLEAYQLLHDGAIAFSHMESAGMRVDQTYLKQALIDTQQRIDDLEKELKADETYTTWRKHFGEKTKIGSTEQLAAVLFGDMQYPCNVWTSGGKSGKPKPSTSEEALEVVDLPFVRRYVLWKQLNKVKTTYLMGIMEEMVDGRVHSSINLNTVRTYRSSMSLINLQNLPVRNLEMGKIVRQAFIPDDGYVLGEFDFGRIEVHVSSWYHHDPVMLKYLHDPTTDMHRDMAAEILLLALDQVAHAPRHTAKNQFVFPEFYGSVYFQCAPAIWSSLHRDKQGMRVKLEGDDKKKPSGMTILRHLRKRGISELGDCNPKNTPASGTFVHHLKEVERRFWHERFKTYTKWKEEWWQQYLRKGGFRMLTGFTVNNLHKKNEVLNSPIQGVAFHCLLWSIIQIDRWLRRHKMRSKIVCQIHDSIILMIHKSELQDVMTKVTQVMTKRIAKHWSFICTPLETEVDLAVDNWFNKKPSRLGEDGLWTMPA